MAGKQSTSTQLQVSVTLTEGSMRFLERSAKDGNVQETLGTWIRYWLDNQARGGLMIEPDQHDYLAKLNDDKRFRDSRALVRAVEKGLKREDGQHSFTINIDPAFVPPLKEYAEQSGMTVDELVQNSTSMVWASNWLYDCTPADGRMIPFTREMLEAIGRVAGNNAVNSSDIGNLIAAGQMVPLSNELAQKVKAFTGKSDVTADDVEAMVAEIQSLRAQVAVPLFQATA